MPGCILQALVSRLMLLSQVAGGKDESVTQPIWTPQNKLLFVSDRTGWWNIYQENNGQVGILR